MPEIDLEPIETATPNQVERLGKLTPGPLFLRTVVYNMDTHEAVTEIVVLTNAHCFKLMSVSNLPFPTLDGIMIITNKENFEKYKRLYADNTRMPNSIILDAELLDWREYNQSYLRHDW